MKFKARLVALGCGKREGINYLDTFAPVAKGETIRLLLALAQPLGLNVHQMDVDTAFLYGGDIYAPTTGGDGRDSTRQSAEADEVAVRFKVANEFQQYHQRID